MVYLLGGASHTGKTNLAQKLMNKYHYSYISIDHIKMGLIRAGLFPDHLDNDEEMTKHLWPVIREMIKTIVENKQNVIIEGCYIPCDWKEDFTEEYLESIRCVFLILSQKYIEHHFEDIREYANIIEDRGANEECTKEWILKINQECLNGCLQHGCEYKLVVSGYDIDEDIFEW